MRFKFEKMIRAAQNSICAAVEEVDGKKFQQDAWLREGGGGGITRVLQVGRVFLVLLLGWLDRRGWATRQDYRSGGLYQGALEVSQPGLAC
jgi:hypothetical protein